MKTALTILFLISCVVLIILVLMQEGKEAGLGSLAVKLGLVCCADALLIPGNRYGLHIAEIFLAVGYTVIY